MRLIDADERIEEVKRSPMDSKLKDCVLYVLQRALTVSAAPENKPLTLEELRKMGGEPVWIVLLNIAKQPRCEIVTEVHEDGIWMVCADDDNDYAAFGLYGKTWLAYARKPEGSEKP